MVLSEREDASIHLQQRQYIVMVSARFVLVTMLTSVLLGFAVGRAARLILIDRPVSQRTILLREDNDEPNCESLPQETPRLPLLFAKEGEEIPQSRYYSKTFDTAKSAMSSSWLIAHRDGHGLGDSDVDTGETQNDDMDESLVQKVNAIAAVCDDGELSQPAAEHLMVDIKNVDGTFLNSPFRLAQAMIDVVRAANLTLLSYHCHGMEPTGVSCAGILTQNYIAFHTWPMEGVITFDLVAGAANSILPVLPVIENRFGVARGEHVAQPAMRWAHKLRGFRHHPTKQSNLFQVTDLGLFLLSILGTEFKEEVASVETDFQRIDIYDVIAQKKGSIESYRKSLSNDGSYESEHNALYRPDRALFLDGWLQSSLFFEAQYHEALVQPALFAHSNPRRVAIIGGGEGATLREVLKHNTVQEVAMIEIDEKMVNASRDSIPEWSDCSDLEGSASWCVDDPRATVYYEDALAWFVDRYSGEATKTGELLDVIILDALDPESEVPFAEALYGNDKFMQAFFESLSDDGVLVMQLGEAPKMKSPDETMSMFKNRATTTKLLEKLGFESIHAYEESHCGFHAPWTYVIGFKSYSSRKNWYSNAAQVDLLIKARSVRTKSGMSPFRYFDGPTMVSYQVPHKTTEVVFCRRQPIPEECLVGAYDFDPELPNIPSSSFEVKLSKVAENAGRGAFAKVDIPEDAYMSAETTVHAVGFMPHTVVMIQELVEEDDRRKLSIFNWYMLGYGFYGRTYSDDPEVFVDSGLLTFANHGCRGNYNSGDETSFDEFTARIDVLDDEVNGKSHVGTTLFNPVVDRHLRFHAASPDTTLRDIEAGEEILCNYLSFTGNAEDWAKDVQDLRAQCAGQAVGEVTDYESRSKQDNSS